VRLLEYFVLRPERWISSATLASMLATADPTVSRCARCNESESSIGPDRQQFVKTTAEVSRLAKRESYECLKSVFGT
jgi:hypothetical protein